MNTKQKQGYYTITNITHHTSVLTIHTYIQTTVSVGISVFSYRSQKNIRFILHPIPSHIIHTRNVLLLMKNNDEHTHFYFTFHTIFKPFLDAVEFFQNPFPIQKIRGALSHSPRNITIIIMKKQKKNKDKHSHIHLLDIHNFLNNFISTHPITISTS